MTLEDYLAGVNKTWKEGDGIAEVEHCNFAFIEETGEIAGWYKRLICYGTDPEEVAPKLKGEFGDLLYYLVKMGELSDCMMRIESRFEATFQMPDVHGCDILGVLGVMAKCAQTLTKYTFHSKQFINAYGKLFDHLLVLIVLEGHTLEDIMYSNLAKLAVRHGDSFKDNQAMPGNRDLRTEDDATS